MSYTDVEPVFDRDDLINLLNCKGRVACFIDPKNRKITRVAYGFKEAIAWDNGNKLIKKGPDAVAMLMLFDDFKIPDRHPYSDALVSFHDKTLFHQKLCLW